MKATLKQKEAMRQYYINNRVRLLQKQLDYGKKHAEEKRIQSRKWRINNPDKARKQARDWKEKTRLKIIKELGGKCNRCSFNDIRALQINHKSVKTKQDKRDYLKRGYDLDKVELLCANCHATEHYEFFKTNLLKYE